MSNPFHILTVVFLFVFFGFLTDVSSEGILEEFEAGLDGTSRTEKSEETVQPDTEEGEKKGKNKKKKVRKKKTKKNDSEESEADEEEEKSAGSCMGSAWEAFECSPILFRIFTSPYWVPYNLLNDDYAVTSRFESYPFKSTNIRMVPAGRDGFVSLTLNSRYLWAGAYTLGGRVITAFHPRWAVETSYERMYETDPDAVLSFASTMVSFTFAQANVWRFRSGLGCGLVAGKTIKFGGRWSYGLETFRKPFHNSLDLALEFSAKNTMFEVSGGFGWLWRRLELEAGYSVRMAGPAVLHGPGFSMRIWL